MLLKFTLHIQIIHKILEAVTYTFISLIKYTKPLKLTEQIAVTNKIPQNVKAKPPKNTITSVITMGTLNDPGSSYTPKHSLLLVK